MKLLAAFRSCLRSLSHLFIPRNCVVCGRTLIEAEHLVCTTCRWHMPMTGTWEKAENPIQEKLHAMFMAEKACALFFYEKQSGYDDLIHKFKYYGKSELAYQLGRWLGEEMNHAATYTDIDIIIPVPLHPLKKLKRGYNQSEHLARGISRALNKPVSTRNLIRTVHNSSQTLHDSADRWENVAGIFALRRPKQLEKKSVLLVDDVLTTGATLDSCAETIRKVTQECRISVAVLTASARDFR